MDRAEFQRYIDNALQEAERVRTYCTQREQSIPAYQS